MSGTLDELSDLIHDKFGLERATLVADKPLAEYGLDSLSLAELIFAVEDRFHIDYPEARADAKTLRELATAIDETVAARAAS